MMTALRIEFNKTRRRRFGLILAALMGVQILWIIWAFRYMDAHDLQQGWMHSLYQFPVLNSIVMPVIAAIIASRLSDVEHQGQTLKLMDTVMPMGRLFDAKFLCGAFYMLAAIACQLLVIAVIGHAKGFAGEPPAAMLGYYFLFTTVVSLTVLVLQETLSLLVENQMVSLAVGLTGGFAGLFVMFLPQKFSQLIIWGYYGVLMLVGMDWNRATGSIDYYWVPVDWCGLAAIMIMFCLIYTTGRALFIRKEL